ncbi:TPA: helix-turn-helix domain-containing protein [Vibrio parahaemolyticus]|uniref:helix-turn-helix domain-containing protein n=2 Tax=Vibrio parahaemolyticus TaxID=670 RepID=UPI001E3DA9D4|nr:helix-turn-helix domain-containing protein [Vibrio parahaemolyticus]MCX8824863.1 helix-turn-helix domain-containing protein [Vibrio parahaemolyticus]MCX8835298.1 helix-turn-helix domain-containing protein [Vibrio parahaemolyticus]MDF4983168.1 helix-turn-helix domain-containing protein [Vibrio parahaemolyticus]MDF5475622.1 helix-turn-helix domain-containing protein [Vibrio parahaemolyticus]MDF5487021.1 helix-turn-helix domain-containing protein [Vibrio parahaemolyticus]
MDTTPQLFYVLLKIHKELLFMSFHITKQIIDAKLKKSHGTTTTENMVLVCLSSYFSDKRGENVFTCFPSQKTLSDNAGCSTVAVNRALKKFEELGFIKSNYRTTPHGGSTSKLYTWLEIPRPKEKETGELSSTAEPNDTVSLESQTDNGSETENSSDTLVGSTVDAVQPSREQPQTTSDWWDDFVQEELEVEESPF